MLNRIPAPVFLLLLLGLTACDSAVGGADSVFLTAELSTDLDGDPVRFVFESADVQTGRLTDVSCDCELDVTEFLADRGFSRDDIISATVASGRLVMLFPISERLDFLDEAILKLQAPGNSVTEVAQQSAFGETREVALDPLPGRDVAGFMDDSAFEPILQIDAAALQAGESYEIGLVLEIRLELAGV
ncbi:MAG: hypothetical protein HKN29_04615 [Rhodothermales bacterium]|nr:hypothetical protein [Rhodothermales bacterium]